MSVYGVDGHMCFVSLFVRFLPRSLKAALKAPQGLDGFRVFRFKVQAFLGFTKIGTPNIDTQIVGYPYSKDPNKVTLIS